MTQVQTSAVICDLLVKTFVKSQVARARDQHYLPSLRPSHNVGKGEGFQPVDRLQRLPRHAALGKTQHRHWTFPPTRELRDTPRPTQVFQLRVRRPTPFNLPALWRAAAGFLRA